ncbi:hypothetical protein SBRY_70113 [Actinacidiphila bryophytorum]|uniref:Uncharacterized protein n=1 Tax=Actinacidiphila bryophytorum TaxID=1436133 RepID=A0A9W4MKJ3_9ACTN|nr:hypothetical protein SBRY_70113 [Actinacidiphila bryophytorum]
MAGAPPSATAGSCTPANRKPPTNAGGRFGGVPAGVRATPAASFGKGRGAQAEEIPPKRHRPTAQSRRTPGDTAPRGTDPPHPGRVPEGNPLESGRGGVADWTPYQ